ncbi:MAG: hypothetical protein JWQ57_1967 [Mucilaginibacter sp.]|nr:hypothetical protein [Mucilaginibacter sp.]
MALPAAGLSAHTPAEFTPIPIGALRSLAGIRYYLTLNLNLQNAKQIQQIL